MKEPSIRFVAYAAVIAALYVVLTLLSASFGLAIGSIQLRFSEALTVLPYFTATAIPGLFIGCVIANLLSGAVVLDVIFGSLVTLLAAVLTRILRRVKWLAPVPPIVLNALVIPFILAYAYEAEESIPFLMATIGAGELLCAGVLGMLLLKLLEKKPGIFSKAFDRH